MAQEAATKAAVAAQQSIAKAQCQLLRMVPSSRATLSDIADWTSFEGDLSSDDVAKHCVLSGPIAISVCRDSLVRGGTCDHEAVWNPFLRSRQKEAQKEAPLRYPTFVCCSLNLESSSEGLFRSPRSGVVQGILATDGPLSQERLQQDEDAAAKWSAQGGGLTSSITLSAANSAHALLWSARSEITRSLEMRINTLLAAYCEQYYERIGDGRCGKHDAAASAYVRPSLSGKRRAHTDDEERERAVLNVHAIIVSGNRPREHGSAEQTKQKSLFDWDDDTVAADAKPKQTNPPWESYLICHHHVELEFIYDSNKMRLLHSYEVRLVQDRAPLSGTLVASHGWRVQEHRRHEEFPYQDKPALRERSAQELFDAVTSMHVGLVADYVLQAVQQAEMLLVQNYVDAAVPYFVRSLGPSQPTTGTPHPSAAAQTEASRAQLAQLVASTKKSSRSSMEPVEA